MYLGYRRSKMEDQGDEFRFAWRALSSWDYTVTDKSGVLVRKAAIRTDFKEMVREEKANETRDRQELIWIYITRVVANLLVIIILGGSGYVIYVVADTTLTPEEVPDFLQDLFSKYQLPVAVSSLKVIVPPMLHFLCKLERWHPRIEIKLNIIRTALFYLASLVVFVTSLYDVSSKCVSGDQNGTFTHRNLSDFCCWENEVGEEIFKVVILDLVVVILVGLVLDVLTAIIVQCHIWNKFGYREFDVTSNVLDLIYSQALIWLGLYFSPFLALIQVIKLVITFYVRYIIARYCNTPPTKVFKASRTGTFYMFILLINLFVALFPMTYSVIVLSPSFDCGPFRLETHVYEVITTRIGNLPVWLQDGLNYVSTSTVIIPLLILLMLAVLYYKTKTSLYQNLITELRNQLKFERRVEKRKVFRKAKVSQDKFVH
ncbi:hypothetical protein SNE40_015523 [Patella caerulea]|uniref:TMC domain-containing protein n=2 Tax=Patella caerulea TaxID=87958 RepID=A0AAN8PL63_PATCE